MTPTPKLRFLVRETPVGVTGMMVHVETILQQWWEISFYDDNQKAHVSQGEWRDVPMEQEDANTTT